MSSNAESIKDGVASSLQRRPAIASATSPGGAGGVNRAFEGRRGLGNAGRIKIERIRPDPDQPRKSFPAEALDRLAENMRIRGQLVPILVRWCPDLDTYLVIDGERRYRAATQAGLADLACVVEDEADPDAILEMQLIANALREDVAPVEQAKAWDRLKASQGLTLRQLGDKLGYDYSTIARGLDLLKLAPEIQAQVDAGEIAASTAGQIARIDDHGEQQAIANRAVIENLSRADVAEAVKAKASTRKATGQGGAGRVKPKARPATLTSRRFRADGIKFEATATRKEGFTRDAYLAAIEAEAARVRDELAQAG